VFTEKSAEVEELVNELRARICRAIGEILLEEVKHIKNIFENDGESAAMIVQTVNLIDRVEEREEIREAKSKLVAMGFNVIWGGKWNRDKREFKINVKLSAKTKVM